MVSRPLDVDPDEANNSQRELLIAALADAVAEKGYRETSISDIVQRSGVDRSSFYSHFESKEEAFLVAFDLLARRMHDLIEQASGNTEDWPGAVEAGLAAMLSFIEAEPNYGHLFFTEFFAVSGVEKHFDDALIRLTPFLDAGRIDCPPETLENLPAILRETLAGGIFWFVSQKIRKGRVAGMELLLPTLVEFVLTPYLGNKAVEERALIKSGGASRSFERLLFDASQIRARHPDTTISAVELIRADRDR